MTPKPPAPPKPSGPSRTVVAVLIAAMLVVPLAGLVLARAFKPASIVPVAVASSFALPSPPSSEPAPAEDRTPEIRGRILDADGNPVEGAAVRLVSPRPPYTVLRETKTAAGGGFSFPHIRAERVRVAADHEPDGVVTSAELRMAEGQTLELTLVLSAASAVRGTVVGPDDHPVEGATLSVEGVPWIVPSAHTDAAGAFRMTTVPQEATSLVAVARGYKTARVALAQREDDTELVVRVRLTTAAPVQGDVQDVDGNPVRAHVVACEGQPSEAATTSGEDGSFELPPSTIGCDAVAQHDEFGPSDPVAVVEGRRLALRLKAGGAIEGEVVDERGVAMRPYTVGIESFSTPRGRGFRGGGRRTIDDPRGSFRWDKLQPGTYVLSASAPGKPPARSDPVDVTAGTTTRNVRIVLLQGGSVTGRVYDDRHTLLAGVDLRFDAVSSVVESTASAKTDESGQYRIDNAPAGPFTLRVQKDGFRLRMMSGLRVGSRGTLTQDIVLTALDGGGSFEFGGVGASLEAHREGISLGQVFPGDPAERAGLRGGDRILRIDGEETDGMSVADVLQRLRGQAGTSVGVSVLRPDSGETIDVTVVRAAIVR